MGYLSIDGLLEGVSCFSIVALLLLMLFFLLVFGVPWFGIVVLWDGGSDVVYLYGAPNIVIDSRSVHKREQTDLLHRWQ